jgi:uncharacterized protein (UPF0332 family)
MTPEQEALLKKAQESIKAAQLLADNQLYDFAVSRAYYAMFYVVEALLLGEGLSFSKHSAVIAAFGLHFTKTGRTPADFHRYLIEGQASRNIGDYDPVSTLTNDQAEEQIRRAEVFLELGLNLLETGTEQPDDSASQS